MQEESVVSAFLVGLSIESSLYGIFCALFLTSISLSIQKFSRNVATSNGKICIGLLRDPLFLSGCWLFCSITAHWAITIFQSFMAFVHFDNGASPGAYYHNMASTAEVAKTVLLFFVIACCDLILLYRLWIVRNGYIWAMAIPLLSYLAYFICTVGELRAQLQYDLSVPESVEVMNVWIIAACFAELTCNVVASGLIMWNLWRMDAAGVGGIQTFNPAQSVPSIFIESASLYVGWNLVYIGTEFSDTHSSYTTVDAWVPISGIAFMLINVRVGLGRTATHNPMPSLTWRATRGPATTFASSDEIPTGS